MDIHQIIDQAEQLKTQGRVQDAIDAYKAWIASHDTPVKVIALFNLAVLQSDVGLREDAIANYMACLTLKADFLEARINLGLQYERLGSSQSALAEWQKVADMIKSGKPIQQDLVVVALNHMGRLYETNKNYQLAQECLRQSLAITPQQPDAMQHWVHLRQKQCEWPVLKALPSITQNEMLRSISPLAMLSLEDDPALQLLAAQSFVQRKYSQPINTLKHRYTSASAKIRIGYVSGDLCTHAVGLLLPDLLEAHDTSKFEIVAFDYSPEDASACRARLKNAFHEFHDIRLLTDEAAAEKIASAQIDFLIDMHGLSSGARPGIFARKPAPIQATYLGFIGTTAMPWIEYVIADKFSLPTELQPYFSEKPLYVDGSFISLTGTDDFSVSTSREKEGLPENCFIYAAFNNIYKLNPEIFSTWMNILKDTPNSVLWLLDDNAWATENLRRIATEHGIDSDRIIFASRTSHAHYCARLRLADLYLDSTPYNAGSTARDVMVANLPMLTMSGKTFVSRMAGSMLHSQGLDELITDSFEAYQKLAIDIGKDATRARNLKEKLAQCAPLRASSAQRLVKSLENQIVELVAKIRPVQTSSLASNQKNCRIFHIAYSEETYQSATPPFEVLDHRTNPRPDWREYWPMREYLLGHTLNENEFIGFFSPRFHEKTGLSAEQTMTFMSSVDPSVDVVTFSPQPDMGAFFINVFEQNDTFDPGFLATAQRFVNELGEPLGIKYDLMQLLMDSREVVFSNYFVAKPAFWRRWLQVCEVLFNLCESEQCSQLQLELTQTTSYPGQVPRKVFLMERIASLLLTIDKSFKVHNYNTFACAWSNSNLGLRKEDAIYCDALKIAEKAQPNAGYLSLFGKLRSDFSRVVPAP